MIGILKQSRDVCWEEWPNLLQKLVSFGVQKKEKVPKSACPSATYLISICRRLCLWTWPPCHPRAWRPRRRPPPPPPRPAPAGRSSCRTSRTWRWAPPAWGRRPSPARPAPPECTGSRRPASADWTGRRSSGRAQSRRSLFKGSKSQILKSKGILHFRPKQKLVLVLGLWPTAKCQNFLGFENLKKNKGKFF